MISHIYDQIHSIQLHSLNSIRTLWEEDLGEDILKDVWRDALGNVHRSSICAKHGIIQCKIIHRAHLTKLRLAKIYKELDPFCDRCHQVLASHVHMFWSCPTLQSYWADIFRSISKITGEQIDPSPLTGLFGIVSPTCSLSPHNVALIGFVTLLTRRIILAKLKSPTPPPHSLWKKDILQFVKLEKIGSVLRGSLRKFYKTWDPF